MLSFIFDLIGLYLVGTAITAFLILKNFGNESVGLQARPAYLTFMSNIFIRPLSVLLKELRKQLRSIIGVARIK